MSQRFVCNASPLIAFERLDYLSLLQEITSVLHIPTAVRDEVFGNRPLPDWIKEHSVSQPLSAFMLKPFLNNLLAVDFRISSKLYQLALQNVGESSPDFSE